MVIVHTLPGPHVLPYQPRFVAPSKFRGDGAYDGFSGGARLAMNVILLIKSINIIYMLSEMANFGR